MASQGPQSPSFGSQTSDTTYGTGTEQAWTNFGTDFADVFADDAATAEGNTATGSGVAYTQRLDLTGFGFSIPAGATIDGIAATIKGASSNSARPVRDLQVRLLIAGTPSGTNLADGRTWSTVATESYGGATTLWGLTPSEAQVNASNFGIALQFDSNDASTLRDMDLNHVTLTVYYTESGGGDITLTQSASETLTLAEQGGTVSLSMPLTQAAAEALVLAEQQGTLSLSIPLAQGSPEALTLTENGGILALSMPLVQSAPEALVITENGGTLTVGSDIALAQSDPETLVLAEQGGVLGLSMPLAQAAPEALTITEHGGLLSLGTPINLMQSAPEALVIAEQGGTLSLSIPLVQTAPEALELTEHGGTVHLSGGIDVRDGSRHGGGIPISDERHPYWRNRIEVEDEPETKPAAPVPKRTRRAAPDHAEQAAPTGDHLARAATPGAEVAKALLGVPLPATEKAQARTSGAPPAVALSAPPARPDAASDALSREQRLIEELLLLELID